MPREPVRLINETYSPTIGVPLTHERISRVPSALHALRIPAVLQLIASCLRPIQRRLAARQDTLVHSAHSIRFGIFPADPALVATVPHLGLYIRPMPFRLFVQLIRLRVCE
jgi:hypothetical protein